MQHDIKGEIEQLEKTFGGRVGVFAAALSPTPLPPIHYRETESFPAASTIKVFILQTLLERVQAGELALEEEVVLEEGDKVTGSGVLKSLSAGRRYTLKDLATLMIIVSDNTATNLLIERLGVKPINCVCQAYGWSATYLAGKLQQGDNTGLSTTSPSDLGSYFQRLWSGEGLNESLTQLAKDIYRKQQYTDQLGRELDFDAYSTETGVSDLSIASKSGSIRGVRNDAGVVTTGRTQFVISIMTKGAADTRFHVNNTGTLAVAAVARVVFDYFVQTSGKGVG